MIMFIVRLLHALSTSTVSALVRRKIIIMLVLERIRQSLPLRILYWVGAVKKADKDTLV